MNTKKPTFVVGIGGSAGGLKAHSALLTALPNKTGMAFVIIAHMNPAGESLLPHLLGAKTGMPVVSAKAGMTIKADHVYVIAPNTDLLIDDKAFKVVTPRSMVGGRHKQVDEFLISLAEQMGPQAISIILSGGDGDGTEGCKQVKVRGGITFAQDLSADVDSMPLNASASGCVDFVLAPPKIAAELVKIAASRADDGSRTP